MAKILMVNVPYSGHTNPTLSLAKRLVERGHQVTYINAPEWKERIEATGALFVPYMDYPEGLPERQQMVRCFKAAYNTAMEVGAGHDLLIYEMFFYLGKTVAERLGIPAVRQFSQLAWTKVGTGLIPLLFVISCHLLDTQVLKRRVAIELGVKDKRLVDSVLHDKIPLNIVYLPERFHPCRQDLDETYVFCIPLLEPVAQPVDTDRRIPYEKMARPVIYISIGTILSSRFFYKRCIKAFGNKECSVILNTGKVKPETLRKIPPNIWAYSFVPQLEVLQHADLFITHGGMNSVNEAMYHGVPMLAMPIMNDQPINAEQVVRLKLGKKLRMLSTAEALYKQAMAVLNNREIKEECKKMKDEMKSGIALDDVIDMIEACLL